jgi:hypothetical protein
MDILQQPDAFCFLSALKDIIIQSNVNVSASFATGEYIFLQESYTPDNENRIYIRELDRLFLPYISQTILRTDFTVTLSIENGTAVNINTTVQYCTAEINVPAGDFLQNHFLTLLRNQKITYCEQKEYLSLFLTENTTVKAIARSRSGAQEEKSFPLTELQKVLTIDVSPALLFSQPEQILYYVVLAGNRDFTYYVKHHMPLEYSQFLFLNSFGVKETFIPSAITQRENKYENQFGAFAGKYRKYDVELIKEYTANTGILNGNMADWIEDMFTSRNVFLLSPGGIEKEIVIEEAKVKRNSAQDEMPAFEFKYRLSKYDRNEYQQGNRIFDDTFDYTFN